MTELTIIYLKNFATRFNWRLDARGKTRNSRKTLLNLPRYAFCFYKKKKLFSN